VKPEVKPEEEDLFVRDIAPDFRFEWDLAPPPSDEAPFVTPPPPPPPPPPAATETIDEVAPTRNSAIARISRVATPPPRQAARSAAKAITVLHRPTRRAPAADDTPKAKDPKRRNHDDDDDGEKKKSKKKKRSTPAAVPLDDGDDVVAPKEAKRKRRRGARGGDETNKKKKKMKKGLSTAVPLDDDDDEAKGDAARAPETKEATPRVAEEFVEVNASLPSQKWMQCDACGKWRTVPSNYENGGGRWTCAEHPDPAWASCDVPEDDLSHVVNVYACAACGADFATASDEYIEGDDVLCDSCDTGPKKKKTTRQRRASSDPAVFNAAIQRIPDDARPRFLLSHNPRRDLASHHGVIAKQKYDTYSTFTTVGDIRRGYWQHFKYDLTRGWATVDDAQGNPITLPPPPARV